MISFLPRRAGPPEEGTPLHDGPVTPVGTLEPGSSAAVANERLVRAHLEPTFKAIVDTIIQTENETAKEIVSSRGWRFSKALKFVQKQRPKIIQAMNASFKTALENRGW